MGFLRNLFCRHKYVRFIRITYGDENNYALDRGGRFIHQCRACGKYLYLPAETNSTGGY